MNDFFDSFCVTMCVNDIDQSHPNDVISGGNSDGEYSHVSLLSKDYKLHLSSSLRDVLNIEKDEEVISSLFYDPFTDKST